MFDRVKSIAMPRFVCLMKRGNEIPSRDTAIYTRLN